MNSLEIARKLASYGKTEDAQKAYLLAIHENDGADPQIDLEAGLYLLETGGNYKVAYTRFLHLYNQGQFREESFQIMTQAFYEPNVKQQKRRYQRNCRLLSRYPYLFRQDFLPFEELSLRFYPFDDVGVLPFDCESQSFGPYVNFYRPVISRNFFQDLEQPVLATDVYSQYELSYLNDTVRKSEWVGRENHIYLHYTSWETFCAYLQCLDFGPLLKDKKIVFLIGDQLSQYPIDFQKRFGIDYSGYPVKPFGIREVQRLIWHTQLSSHNGGDFFNEIFYGHPNLLSMESLMLSGIQEMIDDLKADLSSSPDSGASFSPNFLYQGEQLSQGLTPSIHRELQRLLRHKELTDKDILVMIFLCHPGAAKHLDHRSRIAPALFFQPHFGNLHYKIGEASQNRALLDCEEYQVICTSPLFRQFKYIKTFTPLRRPTTSYGATLKFMVDQIDPVTGFVKGKEEDGLRLIPDVISQRLLNRSFMIDGQDPLYQDCILVRFEDGKLNPEATFRQLAAFLDLPYTESMTYCSGVSGIEPVTLEGNVRGFDPDTVYRTYDDYVGFSEGYFLEYFMRDVYEAYGYDFHYYDGQPVDETRAGELIAHFTTLDGWIDRPLHNPNIKILSGLPTAQELYGENRRHVAQVLLKGLRFVNENNQPLRMMPLLHPDPQLLAQPLYR